MSKSVTKSFRTIARQAKCRIKENFWESYRVERAEKQKIAEAKGWSRQETQQYLAQEIQRRVGGEEQFDPFYEQVKALLLKEGEVSDAIGRLTDRTVYDTLSYTEKQRYTLELSEKYLRALEKFRAECEFEALRSRK